MTIRGKKPREEASRSMLASISSHSPFFSVALDRTQPLYSRQLQTWLPPSPAVTNACMPMRYASGMAGESNSSLFEYQATSGMLMNVRTRMNENVNTGLTSLNSLRAHGYRYSRLISFRTVNELNTGDVTSPMKKTNTVELPPTPSRKTDIRYEMDKKWWAKKSGSVMENTVSKSRYASENCIMYVSRTELT